LTAERYHNYRRSLALLDTLDELDEVVGGRDALRRLAEELLLARDRSDAEPASEAVAIALTRLTVSGALSRALATEVMAALQGCGPAPRDGLIRPPRAA
jgi:hypothetical protein